VKSKRGVYSLRREHMRREDMRREETRIEDMRREDMRREDMRREDMRGEDVRREDMRREDMRREDMRRYEKRRYENSQLFYLLGMVDGTLCRLTVKMCPLTRKIYQLIVVLNCTYLWLEKCIVKE